MRTIYISAPILILALVAIISYAEISSVNNLSLMNATTGMVGVNISTGQVVAIGAAHIAWNGTDNPMGSPDSLSNANTARRLFGLGGTRLALFGPNINLSMLPPVVFDYTMMHYTAVPIYQIGDGIAFAAPWPNSSSYLYGIIRIENITSTNITISYKVNNQSNNRTISSGFGGGGMGGGCFSRSTQNDCMAEPNCYWDFGGSYCKDKISSGGGFAGGFETFHRLECGFFSGNQLGCANITVCVWDSNNQQCYANATTFNFSSGIRCANINHSSLCNNVKDLQPLCSWNASSGPCLENTSKSYTGFTPPPVQFCEAAQNQSVCNILINNFFMPCRWEVNNITNISRCGFKFDNVFQGPNVQGIFDVSSQSACESSGGVWKTETIKKSDATTNYQTVLDTKSWCELGFAFGGGGMGFQTQSCNETCWACEKNGTNNWLNVGAAEAACKGSKLGYCKWQNASFSPNGLGFCEMMGGVKFGMGDCSSSCFSCITQSGCTQSPINCSWSPDIFQSDMNGDGVFDNATDGFCDPAALAVKKNCGQTCFACQSNSTCSASAANCTWANTNMGFQVCKPAGAPVEICFVPGDEDGDGLADCADNNATGGDCLTDPFCGFGASGQGKGGPAGGLGAINSMDCIRWDNNQTACLGQRGPAGSPIENETVCFFHPSSPMATFNATNGLCDPKFMEQMKGGMMIDKPPSIIGVDPANDTTSNQPWLDILDIGIHEGGGSGKMDVGFGLRNVSTAAWCKKSYPLENRNDTAKYYRYFDTDENATNGCSLENNSNIKGWEYKFTFFENATAQQTTAFKCVSGSWIPYAAQVMAMKDLCKMDFGPMAGGPGGGPQGDLSQMGGVSILVINKVDIGNPKKVLRLFVASASNTTNESNPVDTAGPFYYTPGSIDVKFENCAMPGVDSDGDGFVSENDPDCQKFLKLGYIPFEGGPQCQDGIDNDGNGKTDCQDESCKYDPFGICNSGQGMVCDASDKKSPSLKWLDVKTNPNFAFVKYDTDEPANGTLLFYRNDSNCLTLNASVLDFALRNSITQDDYKPPHDAALDSLNLNYSLVPNTTYYYKLQLFDICGNKLVTACLNFTTSTSFKDFVFKPKPPPGIYMNLPELGIANENFTYGKSLNSSETKSVSMSLQDTTNNFTIEFKNMTISKAIDMNISTIFNTNSSTGEKYVGMNTSSWSKLQTDMSPKTINITIPDNGTALWKCDESNLSNCINVTSMVNCTFSASLTTCTIPLANGLGFSTYKVTGESSGASPTPTSAPASSSSSPSGGGSSGGGGGSSPTLLLSKAKALVPGKGIANNQKLLAAITQVLQKGTMSQNAIDNLEKLSESITSQVAATKAFSTKGGKTNLTVSLKNTGNSEIKGLIVHETIPKTFAAAARLIAVSAPKAKNWSVVKDDPEFAVFYDSLKAGEEVSIMYKVNSSVNESVLDTSSTTLLAEEVAAPPAPEEAPEQPQPETQPAPEQAPGAESEIPEPPAEQQYPMPIAAIAGIIILIAVIIIVFSLAGKKGKKKKEVMGSFWISD
ncbi:MAG: hypothetical protein HYX24_05825 [Candidatus Aenigmarchaeota archaeon]|nr:hypothetical protein [Candidatus Aenigmarchaeota archaeon]